MHKASDVKLPVSGSDNKWVMWARIFGWHRIVKQSVSQFCLLHIVYMKMAQIAKDKLRIFSQTSPMQICFFSVLEAWISLLTSILFYI